MKIKLSPVRSDERLVASVSGQAITLNGTEYDFTQLQDGESLPADAVDCKWICGDVRNVDGEICLTLVLPHGINAPQETRFPEHFDKYMTVTSGNVPLPPYDQEIAR